MSEGAPVGCCKSFSQARIDLVSYSFRPSLAGYFLWFANFGRPGKCGGVNPWHPDEKPIRSTRAKGVVNGAMRLLGRPSYSA